MVVGVGVRELMVTHDDTVFMNKTVIFEFSRAAEMFQQTTVYQICDNNYA